MFLVGIVGGQSLAAQEVIDARLGKAKTLNAYFPFTSPTSKEAWDVRRQVVREQTLVANGLWPLPDKTPLKPTLHGKIERDGYTVEKVFFASYPGHYVCGNLYRPVGASGKRPAILSPHGHWANGRFFEASDKTVEKEMKSGAEKTAEGAKYPLQARCAQLARMGCVVFHYDMVGYADSQQIKHREGFLDAEAELRLQNFMGLQTWNSVRALDFLLSLPDVDPTRIGVTGASGGGTQTFLLCAIDDRPAAAFPAVMVSTAMQGGCICENCSYLRVGTGNIELAALWAPKPLGMSAANDWTKDIEAKGYPELKALYRMLGKEENVLAKAYLEFGHNYNQVAREMMYNFFNKHLKLGQPEPVRELPFKPIPPKDLSVYDAEHPLPKDAVDAKGLRAYLTAHSNELLKRSAADPKAHQAMLRSALRAMITDELPAPREVEERIRGEREVKDGVIMRRIVLSRKGQGEAVATLGMCKADFEGRVIVWVHPQGIDSLFKDSKLIPEAQRIVDSRSAILAVNALRTPVKSGDSPAVDARFAGYTFGYNRPLLAERVHDILTAIAYARGNEKTKSIDLVGFGEAGPWVVLAGGLASPHVKAIAADLNRFDFDQVKATDDPMMLPGALKYGGMPSFVSLCAPSDLLVHNSENVDSMRDYRGPIRHNKERMSMDDVVRWLLTK
jgi:dienelactone hydrolase